MLRRLQDNQTADKVERVVQTQPVFIGVRCDFDLGTSCFFKLSLQNRLIARAVGFTVDVGHSILNTRVHEAVPNGEVPAAEASADAHFFKLSMDDFDGILGVILMFFRNFQAERGNESLERRGVGSHCVDGTLLCDDLDQRLLHLNGRAVERAVNAILGDLVGSIFEDKLLAACNTSVTLGVGGRYVNKGHTELFCTGLHGVMLFDGDLNRHRTREGIVQEVLCAHGVSFFCDLHTMLRAALDVADIRCLTGSGNAAGCETVSARKNADGSYTVTLTGVTGNISADIAAHKLVIGELTVPQVLESHPDLNTAEKIKLRLETMMIGTAENRAFYDIALRYKNAEGNWVEVDEANFPTGGVEVVLPYPNGTDSKDTFTIVHMLTTAARAGELELVSYTKQADGLHFRVTSLSPFGVSWVKYAAPSGGGSGGSGGSGGGIFNPAYNIMVERTMNGSITVSPSSAAKGSTVTIMVYPDRGYELEMLMVMDKKGSELDLRKWGGEYSFIMPAGDVTVRARFVEEAPTQSFADVSTDAYYYEAVKWAAKNGITGGVGNGLFAPDAPCTRAQIVTFLWRAAGSPEPKNASSFSDVPASAYYARSVAWAVENGITTGTGNGRFSPDATCTRAQSVTFLYRALSARAEGTAEFRDVPKNAYYADAVAWAAANGITTGIGGGLFGPDNDCTRAQIVTFLFRTYNK